jgi:Ni/Co efflux regulator RcnB
MKRIILSAAIAASLAAAPMALLAQDGSQSKDNPSQPSAMAMHGTVSSVDNTARSFVVKDDVSGKEVTVYWDSSTKVTGDLKAGSTVSLQTSDQGGRMVASSIDAKASKKPY